MSIISTTSSSVDPNVRDKIVMSFVEKLESSRDRIEATGFTGFAINTKLGQPSFISRDLPIIHVMLSNEQCDQYLSTNLYKDIRECSLLVSIYTDRTVVGDKTTYFTKNNIQDGVPHVENVTRLIGTLLLEYEEEGQPEEMVWSQFAGRDLNVADTSDPKTVSSVINYQVRYTLDLNHPYYALGYSLPKIPPANFF